MILSDGGEKHNGGVHPVSRADKAINPLLLTRNSLLGQYSWLVLIPIKPTQDEREANHGLAIEHDRW